MTGQLVGPSHDMVAARDPGGRRTPLVRQLLEIIRGQHERIQQLEDEISRLKGLKTRPVLAPSRLETPPRYHPHPVGNDLGQTRDPRLPS